MGKADLQAKILVQIFMRTNPHIPNLFCPNPSIDTYTILHTQKHDVVNMSGDLSCWGWDGRDMLHVSCDKKCVCNAQKERS